MATKMVKTGGAESAPAVLFTAVRIKPEGVKGPWQPFLHESTCSTSLNMKKSISFYLQVCRHSDSTTQLKSNESRLISGELQK